MNLEEIQKIKEDAERFRWLAAQKGIAFDNARKRGQWACRPAATNYEYTLHPDLRTAVDHMRKGEQ